MWRKIQDVGLSEDYRADRKIRSTLLLPQCLAYLPKKDVVSAFDELKESVKSEFTKSKVNEFYTYFEEYYVAKTIIKRGRYNKKIIERDEPMFAISLWNIHDRLMDDMPRTNNCCESWHNSFTGILNNHPLIYELIDALRHEQNKIESMILKIKTGVVKTKAKKEESASNLMKFYDPNKKLETLNNLALL
ncbi:hypothetical protein BpHYR1_020437 [Brachionus plicatilis]|uniref:Uncharacterized protein n=1 Tax=Brachionus plicatilis TaxID=10195 RepID=A0A3M7RF90_BRAPC|nr:hypothetical protein BpHYR1_020437 [Brachionus plicatilis]